MDMKTNETSEATQTITEDIQENKITETTNPDTIADRIRLIRTNAGLSQQQFADRIMVTRAAISKWENGSGIPSVDSCQIIAREFNVSCDYILLASDEMTAPVKHIFTKLWEPKTKFWKGFSKFSFIAAIPTAALILGILCLANYGVSIAEFSWIAFTLLIFVFIGSHSWGYLQKNWKKSAFIFSMLLSYAALLTEMLISMTVFGRPEEHPLSEWEVLGDIGFFVLVVICVLIGIVRHKKAQRKVDKAEA